MRGQKLVCKIFGQFLVVPNFAVDEKDIRCLMKNRSTNLHSGRTVIDEGDERTINTKEKSTNQLTTQTACTTTMITVGRTGRRFPVAAEQRGSFRTN
ncbi:hypothetical protein T07_3271 [Trichinella nelsoni]|uniref:Uncharacterized protein n=1 Tax=Trichinella nelsoni TaxID=6336 RepID=A0A0V0SK83_9BILA|nr:hypothetical protein T07_3271 [Trichinella nelsoni]